MRTTKRRGATLGFLAVALAAAGCSSDDGGTVTGGATTTAGGTATTTGGGGFKGTFRLGISEPSSIDPYNTKDSESQIVTKALFEGLMQLDSKTNELKTNVAESVTKNATCTQWTFKVKSGQTFSNGEAVNAESFQRAWNRAAAQKAASEVASFMASIKGFTDVNGVVDAATGKATKDATTDKMSGLSTPDPQTLQVDLADADCEFDKVVVHPVFSPVPSTAGAADNKAFNDLPIGNGPFKMAEAWQHDKSITLVPNDKYTGANKPSLAKIEFTIETIADEYKNFQAGNRDFARIPPELAPQAKAQYEKDGSFLAQVTNGFNYLTPSVNNGPLKSADARLAVSYAIDRKAVIDGVFKGLQIPADSIVPPLFEAYYQKGVCAACTFDLTKAKEHAAKGGLTAGTKIALTYNEDGGHKAWIEAVAAQLKTNLGLDVEIKAVPKFRDELTLLKDASFSGLGRTGWGADYPSPVNFLQPLVGTTGASNYSKYSNAKVDGLIKDAQLAPDDAARKAPVQAAEKLALEEMALIPLWYRSQYRVINTKGFSGIRLDFFENPTFTGIQAK